MKIKLLVEGGEMKPGPSIAQQLGPMGINIGKVISEVNNSTKEFKGMKVPVELDFDEKTKNFIIKTFSPPTSELIKKEFALEKGSNKISEIKVANASIEDIIKIAKIKLPNMLEKDLKTAIKSVLGTAASIGILVENKNPNELIQEINEEKFSKEISQGLTEASKEKRQALNDYFNKIKKEQEAKIAAEKAAAEATAQVTAQVTAQATTQTIEGGIKETKVAEVAKTPEKKSAEKKEK